MTPGIAGRGRARRSRRRAGAGEASARAGAGAAGGVFGGALHGITGSRQIDGLVCGSPPARGADPRKAACPGCGGRGDVWECASCGQPHHPACGHGLDHRAPAAGEADHETWTCRECDVITAIGEPAPANGGGRPPLAAGPRRASLPASPGTRSRQRPTPRCRTSHPSSSLLEPFGYCHRIGRRVPDLAPDPPVRPMSALSRPGRQARVVL